jgi:hypothetical protein
MTARQPIINHVIPFEAKVGINEADLALAMITGGSGRVANVMELKNVRLDAVEMRVLNAAASATATPAAPYGVKVFYTGSVAGDDDVVGTAGSLSFNGTAISDTVSVDAGGRRFDKVVIGVEFTGGTTAFTADFQADIFAIGSARGVSLPHPMGGHDSFLKPGSSAVFNATTTDYDVTVAAEGTAI